MILFWTMCIGFSFSFFKIRFFENQGKNILVKKVQQNLYKELLNIQVREEIERPTFLLSIKYVITSNFLQKYFLIKKSSTKYCHFSLLKILSHWLIHPFHYYLVFNINPLAFFVNKTTLLIIIFNNHWSCLCAMHHFKC